MRVSYTNQDKKDYVTSNSPAVNSSSSSTWVGYQIARLNLACSEGPADARIPRGAREIDRNLDFLGAGPRLGSAVLLRQPWVS